MMETLTQRGPLLDAAEERDLGARVRRGGPDATEARNELVRRNTRLVWSIAKKVRRRLTVEDATAAGMLGLIEAARRFDPARGCRFSTSASYWIRQKIGLENRLNRLVRVPSYMVDLIAKAGRGEAVVSKQTRFIEDGRRAMRATAMGHGGKHRAAVYSGGDAGEMRTDTIEAIATAEPDARPDADDLAELAAAVARLSPAEAFVIRRRFGLAGMPRARTLGEIGEDMGLTRERIRQIEGNALERLRAIMGAHA